MTPEELRSLADEATPGPWTTEKRQGDVFVCNPPWQGYEGEWVNHADAHLIALAPDLARLCAELGEALFRFHVDTMHLHERAMADPFECEAWVQDQITPLLTKLFELKL